MPNAEWVAIVGGGPAGLMAADTLSSAGIKVELFDAMPSVARKFLLAGRGGLNLTHTEPLDTFCSRYGDRQHRVAAWLDELGPLQIRAWAQSLGVETFVGSSGRVFPTEMKAAPLLRAWLHRIRAQGVRIHPRHRWIGWTIPAPVGDSCKPLPLLFETPHGESIQQASAVVFALGGGSWAKLGSDGSWLEPFSAHHISTRPLRPANCGFNIEWSDYWQANLSARYAGQPVKSVIASFQPQNESSADPRITRQGELIVTRHGVEGGLIYALSAALRNTIEAQGHAVLHLDLAPARNLDALAVELSRPRGRASLSAHLQRHANIKGIKFALLREFSTDAMLSEPEQLARTIKALPLVLRSPRPIDEAISSAGGVDFVGLNDELMLRAKPGVFCAGEMLDWEAPTGGYLLSASLASGRIAAKGVLNWLKKRPLMSTEHTEPTESANSIS